MRSEEFIEFLPCGFWKRIPSAEYPLERGHIRIRHDVKTDHLLEQCRNSCDEIRMFLLDELSVWFWSECRYKDAFASEYEKWMDTYAQSETVEYRHDGKNDVIPLFDQFGGFVCAHVLYETWEAVAYGKCPVWREIKIIVRYQDTFGYAGGTSAIQDACGILPFDLHIHVILRSSKVEELFPTHHVILLRILWYLPSECEWIPYAFDEW